MLIKRSPADRCTLKGQIPKNTLKTTSIGTQPLGKKHFRATNMRVQETLIGLTRQLGLDQLVRATPTADGKGHVFSFLPEAKTTLDKQRERVAGVVADPAMDDHGHAVKAVAEQSLRACMAEPSTCVDHTLATGSSWLAFVQQQVASVAAALLPKAPEATVTAPLGSAYQYYGATVIV
jgi:hypothetical protein